ncbi:ABC transporter substrate-binding protein [Azospirillum halopraeferens]|uniref:ABC transporter substrate-binding protein n=1 Tax=Azospirillum halopraeferens TaxID=34010 RepID=UPI000402C2C9|nr:ABC transporter substrate-binding protein [Azospirillum halopraeferens]
MRRLILLLLLALIAGPPAHAAGIVDLAGRTVRVPDRVERIVLGEGRFLAALGILDRSDPAGAVVGMMGDFPLLDPAGYARWTERFPGIADIPPVGKVSADSFSAERAIALAPDLAIFGLAGHGPGPAARELIDQLEAAGVTVAFVDFFHDPIVNTPRSITVLGALLGREAEAAAFVAAYGHELERVRDRVARATRRPVVFLENRVGLQEDCCATVGAGVIGRLIEEAGGRNLGSAVVPGIAGMMNPEYLLTHRPDVYVGTAIGNRAGMEGAPGRIVLGPGVDAGLARATLLRALDRTAIADLEAVRAGRAHAVWHHFFHSPFNIVAVQAMARWFQPELCADLDPEATLRDFYARFQPVPVDGTYWIDAR